MDELLAKTSGMKLVSFSGAQSTGKTTLLKALEAKLGDHPDVTFVPEVTRRLKREYNVPINEEATVMTQHLIMADHYLHVHNVGDREDFKLKILDRCSLDGEVYCRYFAEKFAEDEGPFGEKNGNSVEEWMQMADRAEAISKELMPFYDLIFLPDHRDVPLVDDGERSASAAFRDAIVEGFEIKWKRYAIEWDNHYNIKDRRYAKRAEWKFCPKFIVLSGTVEERLETIKKELALLCPEVDIKL